MFLNGSTIIYLSNMNREARLVTDVNNKRNINKMNISFLAIICLKSRKYTLAAVF